MSKAAMFEKVIQAAPGLVGRNLKAIAKADGLYEATNNKAYRKLATKYLKKNRRIAEEMYSKYGDVRKMQGSAGSMPHYNLQRSLASSLDVGADEGLLDHVTALKNQYNALVGQG